MNMVPILGGLSPTAFRRILQLSPQLRNTGVKIPHISEDWRTWEFRLPLRLRNMNYFGAHFGGTLYAAADPHFTLAWTHILPEAIVWDKAASIRFRKPGRGTLHASFTIPEADVEEVRTRLVDERKLEKTYAFEWLDADGDTVATIDKVVHFAAKRAV